MLGENLAGYAYERLHRKLTRLLTSLPESITSAIGIAIARAALHTVESTKLATEHTEHARDNETNALKLKAVSDAAVSAARTAIARQNNAATQIARSTRR